MATCAVVQFLDSVVINVIVADPGIAAPEACFLIEVLPELPCGIGWMWNGTEFIDPNPPPA